MTTKIVMGVCGGIVFLITLLASQNIPVALVIGAIIPTIIYAAAKVDKQ